MFRLHTDRYASEKVLWAYSCLSYVLFQLWQQKSIVLWDTEWPCDESSEIIKHTVVYYCVEDSGLLWTTINRIVHYVK